MRRTWPYLLGVALVGAVTGALIVGRPASPDSFVLRPDQVATPVASSTAVPPTSTTAVPAPPTTAEPVEPTTVPTSVSAPIRTTSPAPTTTARPGVRPESEVRVVVANAAATDGLARDTAAQLATLGYLDVVATTAQSILDTSVVYYRPGFDREARRLLAELGFEASSTAALPDVAVSDRDADGDVIILLGTDRRP